MEEFLFFIQLKHSAFAAINLNSTLESSTLTESSNKTSIPCFNIEIVKKRFPRLENGSALFVITVDNLNLLVMSPGSFYVFEMMRKLTCWDRNCCPSNKKY